MEMNGPLLVAIVIMVIGLVGAVLPLIPGSILILLGALFYAWATGFQSFGWPQLLVMGAITVFTWLSDLLMTSFFTRLAGGSWRTVAGAIVGGLLGAFVLTIIPGVGTFFGAIAGAILGIIVVEYQEKQAWAPALKASAGYIVGYIVSALVQLTLCLLMVGFFLWSVLR